MAEADEEGVCLTPECIRTAEDVKSKMNMNADPCDDFYEFACGKFVEETQVSDDVPYVDVVTNLRSEVLKQQRDLLMADRPETDPKYIKVISDFYKTCINEDLTEKFGIETFKEISESLGGWPVVVGKYWDENNTWTLQETVKRAAHIGLTISPIFDVRITPDVKNNTKYIIALDQGVPFLNREIILKGLNSTIMSAYYDLLRAAAEGLGAIKETAAEELKESLNFALNLAKISWSRQQRRYKTALYNLRTIKELQESYPYVQWLDYLNGLLPEGLSVDENEVVNVMVPSFFKALDELLKSTDKRIIANYVVSEMIVRPLGYLPKAFREDVAKFEAAYSGNKKSDPKWMNCLYHVRYSFTSALASLYVREYFQPEIKTAAWDVVNHVRGAYQQTLNNTSHLDELTKQEAIRKMNEMKIYVGYNKELLKPDKLEQDYRNYESDPNSTLRSVLKINAVKRANMFSKLRLPVEHEFKYPPYEVSAYYNREQNTIYFSAAALQGPIFNPDRPMYMNFGTVGFIFGLEISKAFDDKGRMYDYKGNLVDWWQINAREELRKKSHCLMDYYDEQTGLTLSGRILLEGNIADITSVTVSYLAYNQYVAQHGEEKVLPGLNYTPRQLFWISAAQSRCEKLQKGKSYYNTKHDVPAKYRIQLFGHSEGFPEAFHCPKGSPMNPEQKCDVY